MFHFLTEGTFISKIISGNRQITLYFDQTIPLFEKTVQRHTLQVSDQVTDFD